MSNNFGKELKHNKYTILVFFIFLGLFVIGWIVFGLIMPNGDENKKYGNRLDDIISEYDNDPKKVEQAVKDTGDKIVSDLKKKSFVKDASISVEGRIINVIVEVSSKTSVDTAKTLSNVVLDAVNDKQKKLYDLQLFIKNENTKSKEFPIIGYKNSSDKKFVF